MWQIQSRNIRARWYSYCLGGLSKDGAIYVASALERLCWLSLVLAFWRHRVLDILISLFTGAFLADWMLRSVLIPKLAIEMTFHGCGKSLSPLQYFQYVPRQLLLDLVLTAALIRFPAKGGWLKRFHFSQLQFRHYRHSLLVNLMSPLSFLT